LVRPEVGGWQFITEEVVSSAAASVTLSGIPGTYRTLVLLTETRSTYSNEYDYLYVRFNGDSGSNYDFIRFYFRVGSSTPSFVYGRADTAMMLGYPEGATSRADTWAASETWLPGYSRTDREKWAYTPNAGRFGDVDADNNLRISFHRARWRNTAAITSITLYCANGNIDAGSVFSLYGIL
jgi:hypothetical protein